MPLPPNNVERAPNGRPPFPVTPTNRLNRPLSEEASASRRRRQSVYRSSVTGDNPLPRKTTPRRHRPSFVLPTVPAQGGYVREGHLHDLTNQKCER